MVLGLEKNDREGSYKLEDSDVLNLDVGMEMARKSACVISKYSISLGLSSRECLYSFVSCQWSTELCCQPRPLVDSVFIVNVDMMLSFDCMFVKHSTSS